MLLNVTTTVTKDVAVSTIAGVDVLLEYDDGTMLVRPTNVPLAAGSARKNPEDRFNKTIGYQLSVGRALKKLSKSFIKQGDGLVKHTDDMGKLKAEQAAMQQELDSEESGLTEQLRIMYNDILSSDTLRGLAETLGFKVPSTSE